MSLLCGRQTIGQSQPVLQEKAKSKLLLGTQHASRPVPSPAPSQTLPTLYSGVASDPTNDSVESSLAKISPEKRPPSGEESLCGRSIASAGSAIMLTRFPIQPLAVWKYMTAAHIYLGTLGSLDDG